jgi:hypothetical protein
MKKLLAMLVALVLALSCTAALAEAQATEEAGFNGLTITSTVDVDRDAVANLLVTFGYDEGEQQVINALAALLDVVEEHTVIADGGVQYELSLNGKEALNLGGTLTPDGISVVSSLIPSYVVKVSIETIGATIARALSDAYVEAEAKKEAEESPLNQRMTGYADDFGKVVSGSIAFSDPVEFNYDYEGHQFNYKIPMTVDMRGITAAANDMARKILKDKSVKRMLKQAAKYGVNVNIDEDLEADLFNVDTVPAVDGAMYVNIDSEGNQSDEVLVNVAVTPDGAESPATIVDTLVMGNQNYNVVVQMPQNHIRVVTDVQRDENNYNYRCDMEIAGMYIGLAGVIVVGDDIQLDVDMYLVDREKPLVCAKTSIVKGGELTISFDESGKTEFYIEEAMGEEGMSAASGLLMDALGGVFGLIQTINEAVPEMSTLTDSVSGLLMGGMGA